ncbi:MAG TPA: plastocyanin/azurin family copper-binding protein [Acidimicrobiia bacterium]|nr:plastocyanin/azurin family copper-binding protein [Acidimicrobiia bacterium]
MEPMDEGAVQSDRDRAKPRGKAFLILAVVCGLTALVFAVAAFFVSLDARSTAQDARTEAREAVATTDTGSDATDADHDEEPAEEAHGESEDFAFGEPAEPSEATRTIDIDAFDIGFEPTSVEVAQGETVLFEVHNTGKTQHDFTVGDLATQDAHEQEMAEAMAGGNMGHGDDPNAMPLVPGKTQELAWTFTVPGVFVYGCHVPGHYDAGMLGSITVTPA